jgi:short-subunit dehydrogenase
MELRGKTILLTGASSGIGYALSRLLAEEHVRLALLARREEVLLRLAEDLKAAGSEILPVRCDVSSRTDVADACLKIKSRFGPVDVAIFNSGLAYRAGLDRFDLDAARAVFDVNVFGLLNFLGELLPDFIQRRSGAIVGVSSLSDCRGFPRSGFYNASKTAMTFLLESLRIELKSAGIRVLTVKPGFVKTPMTEGNRYRMPFPMTADQAAARILKGIKKEKRVIRFPLPTVLSTWLLKAMPDALYERIAARIKD